MCLKDKENMAGKERVCWLQPKISSRKKLFEQNAFVKKKKKKTSLSCRVLLCGVFVKTNSADFGLDQSHM